MLDVIVDFNLYWNVLAVSPIIVSFRFILAQVSIGFFFFYVYTDLVLMSTVCGQRILSINFDLFNLLLIYFNFLHKKIILQMYSNNLKYLSRFPRCEMSPSSGPYC